MSAYWIAHVTVHDVNEYKHYQERAKNVFESYDAHFVVRSNVSESLEGSNFQRHVIIQFKDMDTALACYHSPLYQEAKKYRDNASTTMITIVSNL